MTTYVTDLPQWAVEKADDLFDALLECVTETSEGVGLRADARDLIARALADAAPVEVPRVNIRCETRDGVVTGITSLNVVRVEAEDDGSWTAVTDYWPARALIDAARPKWQPIGDEHKDGDWWLGCCAQHYTTNGFAPIPIRWGTYHPNSAGKACWRTVSGHKVGHITHVMPLPDAPVEDE